MPFDELVLKEILSKMSNEALIAYAQKEEKNDEDNRYQMLLNEFMKRNIDISSIPVDNTSIGLSKLQDKLSDIYSYLLNKKAAGITNAQIAAELKENEGINDDVITLIFKEFENKFNKKYIIKQKYVTGILIGIVMILINVNKLSFDKDCLECVFINIAGFALFFTYSAWSINGFNKYNKIRKQMMNETK